MQHMGRRCGEGILSENRRYGIADAKIKPHMQLCWAEKSEFEGLVSEKLEIDLELGRGRFWEEFEDEISG